MELYVISIYDHINYLCRYSLLEDQQKTSLEDSLSSSDDDEDCVKKTGRSDNGGETKKKLEAS